MQRVCNENDYVTISAIAKDLGISGRTVLREIPEVERFLQLNGYSLDKKTGVGIKVNGSMEDKQSIINILEGKQNDKIYSPLERKNLIVSELLQNHEPVKLYNFTKILKVTEATISNDLEKADEWFRNHNIKLIRKPGLGVYVEGKENHIRKAMVSLIYENLDESELLSLVRQNSGKIITTPEDITVISGNRLLNLIDNKIIKDIETLVEEMEMNINHKLADSAYVALIVHLALAIERIKKGDKITINQEFLKELKDSEEYLIGMDLKEKISKKFSLDIPEDEVGYITMHIKGSKNRNEKDKSGNKIIGSFELIKLSKEIIKIAESETGRFIGLNENFFNGLVNHLGTAIIRLKMNLDIRNPLLEEIKTYYSDLMMISTKCVKVVEDYLGIKMPESEIAFIAMHIGAAIENSEGQLKTIYKIAIACPTGMGTSRLLATRIENEYENIEIVDIISTINIEESWLREKGIDFIISTVNIDKCPITVIRVNPLLLQEDKNKIEKHIKNFKNLNKLHTVKKNKNVNFKEKLIKLNSYSQAIIQLIDNFFLETMASVKDIDTLIVEASNLVGQNAEKLKLALKGRAEKGNIVITSHELILLHCRTDAVEQVYFGAIKLQEDLKCLNSKGETENIKIAIIMLAPEDCHKYHLEVLGYLSRMLIESADFLKFLKGGDQGVAFEELNDILKKFYNLKVNS